MKRVLLFIQKQSKVSLLLLLFVSLLAPVLDSINTPKASAAYAGDGVIVVTLDQAPKTAAKVTATRSAAVPADIGKGGQEIPPETVNLTVGTGPRANNKGYTSPVLDYSGFSSQPCRDLNSPWNTWIIKVSGSATGTGTAHVECGGVVATDVAVTLNGAGTPSKTTGIISGVATAPDGTFCNSSSTYQLVTSGTDPASISFQNGAGKPLPIDATGNYTIGGVAPGNYDLYIDCVYGSGGSANDAVQTAVNLDVTAGTTTSATLGAVGDIGNVPKCESNGNALSWMFCPLISGLASAVDGIYKNFVQPMLRTSPIGLSTTSGDPTNVYAVWQNFRVFGNIFLIIALLAIVFSEALGGGMIDAYAARKMLPRMLVAAIAINLSIYIIAFAVDITNILGNGIASLMLKPFQNADAFVLDIGGGTAALGFTALVGGGIWAVASIGPLLQFLFVFVLLPAFFVFIAILVTVIVRQALIIFLIMVAPVAFALYVLPNTEQYFRKWWDLLFRTLLVYPIIAVVFALGNIMAVVINSVGQTAGMSDILASFLSIIALIVPLIAIPYSFRLAGGLIGRLHDVLTNYGKRSTEAIKGNDNDPNSLRRRTRERMSGQIIRQQAQAYRTGKRIGAPAKLNSFLFGTSLEKEAAINTRSKQRIFSVKDNGDDSIVNARASFIDPADGKRRTLDGKEVSATDWESAKRLYPTLADLQSVVDYRSTKVLGAEQATQFTRNFGLMAQQMGLSPEEATGNFTATSFARQNERGEWKHGKFTVGSDGSYVFSPVGTDGAANDAFLDEQYYKRGSFEGSRMFSSYFDSMADIKKGYVDKAESLGSLGVRTEAQEQQFRDAKQKIKQIREIERSFDMGMPTGPGENGAEPRAGVPGMREGLQGANAASQAAFARLKSVGKDSFGGGLIEGIDSEIDAGDTYEKYDPGNRKTQSAGPDGKPR